MKNMYTDGFIKYSSFRKASLNLQVSSIDKQRIFDELLTSSSLSSSYYFNSLPNWLYLVNISFGFGIDLRCHIGEKSSFEKDKKKWQN